MTVPAKWRLVRCADCGADAFIPPAQSNEVCPVCGSSRVNADHTAAEPPPISALLPFALPEDRITAIYRQWLGTRLFRPHGLNRVAAGRLRAISIPAWLCRGTAVSSWTIAGDAAETADPSSGQHTASYSHVLISASGGLPAEWPAQLGGFDLGQLRPAPRTAIPDYSIEAPAVGRATALTAAREQIERSERATCAALVPGLAASSLQVQTMVSDLTADLVGLPIWLASFSFHGTSYRCLINGQTGTVSGEAPVSSTKIAVLFGLVILAIAAVLLITQLYGS